MELSTATSVEDVIAQMETEAARIASELYTETLSPILRKATGYEGDFAIVATSKMKLDTEGSVIHNSISLKLEFPTALNSYDIMEQVQRTILVEMFQYVLSRQPNL